MAVDRIAGSQRVQATCLERAVALTACLRARLQPARVVIGVKRDGPLLVAHAWVDCNGDVVLGAGGPAGLVPLPPPSGLRLHGTIPACPP